MANIFTIRFFVYGRWTVAANQSESELRDLIDMCINQQLKFEVSFN